MKSNLPGVIMRALPKWLGHVGSHTLLEDDQVRQAIAQYDEQRSIVWHAKKIHFGGKGTLKARVAREVRLK